MALPEYEKRINEFLKNQYSTEEVVIGTFLDKPLYRKVIATNVTFTSNSFDTFDTNVDNLEILKKVAFLMQATSGTFVNSEDSNSYCNTYGNRTNVTCRVTDGAGTPANNSGIVWIEYTKSTD